MKLLLYCCEAKPYLVKCGINTEQTTNNTQSKYATFNFNVPKNLNGKIVAECDYEVEEIKYDWYPQNIVPKGDPYYTYYKTSKIEPKEFYKKSCLNWEQLNSYLNDYDSQKFDGGYAIHIKNLHIFDEPKELNKCWENTNEWWFSNNRIEKAPQNMRYCGNWNFEKYILISIRPEWLCKILNGEKTIEIRKKVLKEMLKNE